MCLAIPMKLEKITGTTGIVTSGNFKQEVGLALIDNPKEGNYVLVHAGFAIQKLNEEEASKTLETLRALLEPTRNHEIYR